MGYSALWAFAQKYGLAGLLAAAVVLLSWHIVTLNSTAAAVSKQTEVIVKQTEAIETQAAVARHHAIETARTMHTVKQSCYFLAQLARGDAARCDPPIIVEGN